MPQDDKYIAWHLRFDIKDGATEGSASDPPAPPPRWPKDFPVKFGVIYLVQEQGDQETPNPHYHVACVFSTPESKQTLKNRFQKMFPGHIKADYALMPWKAYGLPDDNLLTYMSKGPVKTGTPEKPIVLINATLHDPEALYNKYWATNAIMKSETSDKKKPMYEIIIDRCIKFDSYEEQQEEVIAKTLAAYRGKIADHIAFPCIQAVMYHFYPKRTEIDFASRMRKKFSPY